MEKNRIILDTSGYSAYLRGSTAIRLAIQQTNEIFFNPIIVGELLAGYIIGKSEKKNRAILQKFLSSPRVKIVDIDEETSERYAIIMNYLHTKGTPIPTNDLWIAASAMQHGLMVLTTDNHYLKVPQIITEYYQAG
ncbi:MAG TPA: VapC toxin family PIN domain ribonuclease [Nitrospiraceae bacterium]|nr:VapC toxin family PIN domain ribonuclease [Nitrospiraceae bacterium]